MPEEGAQIIASNHLSYYDPIVIALLLKRPIHYMAKEEFFQNKIFGKFLSSVNAFSVKQGRGRFGCYKKGHQDPEKEGDSGCFSRRDQKSEGTEVNAQAGTALIAMKTGACVIPVACIGTQHKILFVR